MISYSHEPDQLNLLTTEQVLSAARKATAYRPTPRQLHYWADSGLLSKPTQHSLGQGRGSVALWDAETVGRLALILDARTGRGKLNVTLSSATLLLVLKGYMPTKPNELRTTLADYLHELDELAANRRQGRPAIQKTLDWLDYPSRRLARALDTLPDRGLRLLRSSLTLMLPDTTSDAPDPWRRLGFYWSPEGMRAALDGADDQQLHAAYAEANALLDGGLLAETQMLGPFLYGPVLPERLLARIPRDVKLSTTDLYRIPATLASLTVRANGSEMVAAWAAAAKQIEPLVRQYVSAIDSGVKGAETPSHSVDGPTM
jgi:DNA-binding transcriptional MerR regulator